MSFLFPSKGTFEPEMDELTKSLVASLQQIPVIKEASTEPQVAQYFYNELQNLYERYINTLKHYYKAEASGIRIHNLVTSIQKGEKVFVPTTIPTDDNIKVIYLQPAFFSFFLDKNTENFITQFKNNSINSFDDAFFESLAKHFNSITADADERHPLMELLLKSIPKDKQEALGKKLKKDIEKKDKITEEAIKAGRYEGTSDREFQIDYFRTNVYSILTEKKNNLLLFMPTREQTKTLAMLSIKHHQKEGKWALIAQILIAALDKLTPEELMPFLTETFAPTPIIPSLIQILQHLDPSDNITLKFTALILKKFGYKPLNEASFFKTLFFPNADEITPLGANVITFLQHQNDLESLSTMLHAVYKHLSSETIKDFITRNKLDPSHIEWLTNKKRELASQYTKSTSQFKALIPLDATKESGLPEVSPEASPIERSILNKFLIARQYLTGETLEKLSEVPTAIFLDLFITECPATIPSFEKLDDPFIALQKGWYDYWSSSTNLYERIVALRVYNILTMNAPNKSKKGHLYQLEASHALTLTNEDSACRQEEKFQNLWKATTTWRDATIDARTIIEGGTSVDYLPPELPSAAAPGSSST